MNKTNIILIAVAVVLIVIVLAVRSLFVSGLETFKADLTDFEAKGYANFLGMKDSMERSLYQNDTVVAERFASSFFPDKAIVEKDTHYTFLYLNEELSYRRYSFSYLDCLLRKCKQDAVNELEMRKVRVKESEFEKEYGKLFADSYTDLRGKILGADSTDSDGCAEFQLRVNKIEFSEDRWIDFHDFLQALRNDLQAANRLSDVATAQMKSSKLSTKAQLNNTDYQELERQVGAKLDQILVSASRERSFTSTSLGTISYSVPVLEFKETAYDEIANAELQKHLVNNSLRTGAMPYSNCFGSSNGCGGYGCSEIKVQNGGADVVVTIKNDRARVVRHGYIDGGNRMTFHVPNGSYQVFFYSGTGWDPNKRSTSTSCDDLRGGFVSEEEVTKDDMISLYDQVMTYELIDRVNGNFQAARSSKGEAF